MTTLQDQMRAKLLELNIPAKEINVYGSQIMVTCRGRQSAERYARVLRRFCRKVRGPWESVDENQKNKGTVLRPSVHRVWRVWGTI